jgi:Flp pilus assembly protein TadD
LPTPAPPAEAPPAEAPPPPGEAEELAEAFRLLRREHDAGGALARLDDYQRRHPGGSLAREAVLARVEALLSMGRDGAALAALEGLTLDGSEVDRPVALARAELRAAADRCGDAVADFARAAAGNDAVAARALYGRGICHLRTGDRRAARAAFESYRRLFPIGPRRADVDRALAGSGD